MKTVNLPFEPEDVLIQLTPELDEEKNWTGALSVNIVTSDESSLCESDTKKVITVAKTLCAALPMYEDNEDILEMAMWYVKNNSPVSDEEESKVQKIKENVIYVNFKNSIAEGD